MHYQGIVALLPQFAGPSIEQCCRCWLRCNFCRPRRFTRGNVRKVLLIHSVNPYYDPLVFVTAFTPMIITCQRLLTYPHTDLLTYPPT